MNLALWTAIREYVAAEVALGVARHAADFAAHGQTAHYSAEKQIPQLAEQSTRMEDAVRVLLSDSAEGSLP